MVELEAWVRLGDEVPVRRRPEIIVPGRRSAGGGNRRWFGGLADMGKDTLHRGGLGDESDDAHVRAAVGADQVVKDSNSRASSMAQR